MKKIIVLLFALSFSLSAAAQDPTPPSEASIRTLLELTNARHLVDASTSHSDQMMQAMMKQQLGNDKPTPAQQAFMDEYRNKILALLGETISWEKMEPRIIDVYEKSFSQNEVDGMIAFYSSPAGQAVVAKLPLVQQNVAQMMQGQLLETMPKIQALAREMAEKLKLADQNQDSQ